MRHSIITTACVLFGAFLATSCGLDNYGAPDSSISGGIYDAQTGELIAQDIVKGTEIEYVEQGFENPETQKMVFKVDGTYTNNLIFAGEYEIAPVRGNFLPVDPERITVKGATKHDFKVTPYVRIKNASITKEGGKIVATFSMEQTTSNVVKKIGLYAHQQPQVGEFFRQAFTEVNVGTTVGADQTFRIELNTADSPSVFVSGRDMYFRVGALTDAAESKSNYSATVKITM